MPAVIAWAGSVIASLFTDKVASWIAFKLLLIFAFTVLVPIVLNNFFYDIVNIVIGFASSQASGSTEINGTMSFTGFAAYLISVFRIPETLAVLVSSLCLRASLSMIPFVRL